jgi:PAS domain S-box-containing protein
MLNNSSSLVRYSVALLAVAAAVALRAVLTPWMGNAFPLATMFSAVAFVVWAAGGGPAMVTALAGWFAAGLAIRGTVTFIGGGFTEVVGLGVYLLTCGSIVVLGEAMRAAQRKLEEQRRELASSNLTLASRVEAQSLLAAIVSSSEDAIASKTLDGTITSWNKGAERIFGWKPEEAIGRPITLIVPPELRDQEREILERLQRGEHSEHLDVERVRKDGTRVHVSITISPVYDRHGHIIGASKTARDITLRKAWQDNLVRSEEAQRLLVGIHDSTRGLMDPAIVMREIVTRVGLHFDVMRCAYGEVDNEQEEVTVARGYTRGVPTAAGRYPLRVFGPALAAELKAGRTAVIPDVRASPLTSSPEALETYAAMQVVSMVCVPLVRVKTLVAILVMCDGAPRNWTDDEANLLEQVAERTLFAVESARVVETLQEADRRKDEFLATLAHELRNPLAPINSGLQILRSARDPSQASTALQIMERQVGQMVRLVDDLLDVARITTGKVDLRCEPVDLATAISDAVETSEPLLRGRPLTITPPAEPLVVNADRTRLAQVFANLLNNSAKYSEPGQPIAISFSRDGSDAVVHVRDHGVGIHPDMLPRVFEMFRQADRTGGRSRGGLGIGLSLVKRIIEMHGGSVTAHSAGPGRGSEFVVRMPALDGTHAAAHRREVAPAGAPQPRRKILVVDDNEDAAESLATLLAINGHETRTAHDGPNAVTEVERFNPDVVFLDIGMPIMDGHETARLIRQQPRGQHIVLVALTGWGQAEDRRRSKDAGFNHHLVKPADPVLVTKLLSSLG